MLLVYDGFIQLYRLAVKLAAYGNKKAAAWIDGRKKVAEQLQKNIAPADAVIWMHCSSAGEFEQGKPVIEALKAAYPQKKILVTFFSPSGYGAARNYPHADILTYLPLDTKKEAERFYHQVRPSLVIFVKYEFWYHHLATAAFHHVPILLISAVFRKDQLFFRTYGGFYRQMLFLFRHIFVQDSTSLDLLQANGISHCSIGGDTRFDRVVKIAKSASDIPLISEFAAGKKLLVAGSTWPGDEDVLALYVRQNRDVKLIIVPHEINAGHISQVQALFDGALLYSALEKGTARLSARDNSQTLIIDCVGLLSRLYRYATITYVGGGFTKDGIHNILEAAVWGKPVLFGPHFEKYREGKEMIAAGGAFSFADAGGFKKIADDLLTDENHLRKTGLAAKRYIDENTGATGTILEFIQEKRLLTN
ncbi:3-deoxy-D-manno-octulosonic acid transferase [Flavisolibacter nicotianae]|uniref:3-deoxy-D-manno-octulosonic acid transferase n=1 Tax=Flavisolibacter nicotianae TaxID=2364882 RepID=UPI0013C45198|nr:glycosyltransferase N-terminal domain-containing protein [Flavisolibacter nicotianae]